MIITSRRKSANVLPFCDFVVVYSLLHEIVNQRMGMVSLFGYSHGNGIPMGMGIISVGVGLSKNIWL